MKENETKSQGASESRELSASAMVAAIAAMQDYDRYRDLAWEGSFEEYLKIVRERPQVTRNAFQRVYDMVHRRTGPKSTSTTRRSSSATTSSATRSTSGKDAVFGLDIPLMRLMNVLKAASEGYGPERRVILLHGPVGSAKSTIARLLKKGIERYSTHARRRALHLQVGEPERDAASPSGDADTFDSPMHEEPLRLIPREWREAAIHEARALERQVPRAHRGRPRPRVPLHLQGADAAATRATGARSSRPRAGASACCCPRRTASASAPSSRRTRRTRTRPSSPATSTTARSPSTAPTPIRAPSTSTASSTSPTAASSSSSRS